MNERLARRVKQLPTREGELHALCPAGIGDFLWIWSKFHSVAKKRPVTFWFPQAEQNRAQPLAAMLGAASGYLPDLSTEYVWSQPGEPKIPDTGGVITVQPNRHLEAGHRLEKWYPRLPFALPQPQILAKVFRQEADSFQYVVAFMCHAGYMEGNLLPGMWARLFKDIEKSIAPVLIVAAGADVGFARKVLDVFDPTLNPVFDAPLDQVAALLAGAQLTVGVASGITVLSTYLGTPTLHGYPRWLAAMPGTWEQPEARSDWCFVDELVLPTTLQRIERLCKAK